MLQDLWQSAVAAVRGDEAVRNALLADPIAPPQQIIAVGKAAGAMARAAADLFPETACLVVTKYDHGGAPEGAVLLEAAHPVPDAMSLKAGEMLLETVAQSQAGDHLLFLVSGGASALAEHLPDGMTLKDLAQQTEALLASGADIHAMNAHRKTISRIKGGKLLGHFRGAAVTVLAISDVEGDAVSVIGSGLGEVPAAASYAHETRVVASNAIARAALAKAAPEPLIENAETLYDDVETLAGRIGARLRDSPSGLYLWGGEPTVVLPPSPGLGGRNMALALHLAREIAGQDIEVLVAGTDGTDGPTDAAGAHVTGATWEDSAADALASADAYPWLAARGALFKSGPTGTNVMDLLIARKA